VFRCRSASDALLLESDSLPEDRDRGHDPPRADEALADGIWSWGWHDDDAQEQPSVVAASKAAAAESGNGTPEVSQYHFNGRDWVFISCVRKATQTVPSFNFKEE